MKGGIGPGQALGAQGAHWAHSRRRRAAGARRQSAGARRRQGHAGARA